MALRMDAALHDVRKCGCDASCAGAMLTPAHTVQMRATDAHKCGCDASCIGAARRKHVCMS